MSLLEILDVIRRNNLEIEVYNALHETILSELENVRADNGEAQACLRAIKKINANKNEAIDALCE